MAQTLEEIIFPATKGHELRLGMPLATAALLGHFTSPANIDKVKGVISFVPGFTGNSQDSFSDAASVRCQRTQGIGIGGDPLAALIKMDLHTYYGSHFMSSSNGRFDELKRVNGELTDWATGSNFGLIVNDISDIDTGVQHFDDAADFKLVNMSISKRKIAPFSRTQTTAHSRYSISL